MFEPLPKKVAVVPLFDPDMSPSGLLYVPEQAKGRSDQGIVKYIGKDCELVHPGDLVVFSGYAGENLRVDNELLIVINEEHIAAVVEGEGLDEVEVPGLYFRGTDGVYFQATYEFAIELIAKAVNEAPWRRGFKNRHRMTHAYMEDKC